MSKNRLIDQLEKIQADNNKYIKETTKKYLEEGRKKFFDQLKNNPPEKSIVEEPIRNWILYPLLFAIVFVLVFVLFKNDDSNIKEVNYDKIADILENVEKYDEQIVTIKGTLVRANMNSYYITSNAKEIHVIPAEHMYDKTKKNYVLTGKYLKDYFVNKINVGAIIEQR